VCYSLSVLDLAFWDYIVSQFICVCVRSSFFSTVPRDWLERISPKLSMLCRLGRKTS